MNEENTRIREFPRIEVGLVPNKTYTEMYDMQMTLYLSGTVKPRQFWLGRGCVSDGQALQVLEETCRVTEKLWREGEE